MRIGFIGAGSMAGAIARGAAAAGLDATEFAFSTAHPRHAQDIARELGAHACASNAEVAEASDYVVLGVAPSALRGVIREVAPAVRTRSACVVSIAAGRSLASIEQDFGAPVAVVRAMPNIAARLGQSVTALAVGAHASPEQVKGVRRLFGAVGTLEDVPESLFPVASAIGGASLAWICDAVEALARAGVKHGLTKDQAVRIAAQAVAGTGALILDAAAHGGTPQTVADRVCSPGGTTIVGLLAAADRGLGPSLAAAVDQTVARDRQLG